MFRQRVQKLMRSRNRATYLAFPPFSLEGMLSSQASEYICNASIISSTNSNFKKKKNYYVFESRWVSLLRGGNYDPYQAVDIKPSKVNSSKYFKLEFYTLID